MNLSISACKASHWRANEFERAIHGPKLEQFRARSYGSAVDMLSIILETQIPKGTLKHYTRYHAEHRLFYCHFVLENEALNLPSDRDSLQAIAATIVGALKKSLRKLKNEDFNSTQFEMDFTTYLDQCLSTLSTNETSAESVPRE